jgi:hypothetical protein
MIRILPTVLVACLLSSLAFAQQKTALDVGTQSQLFIDGQAVYESTGIAFTPHVARKHTANPVLTADQPWEGWYVSAFTATALFDEQTRSFQMWYNAPCNPEYFAAGSICYATSKDGLHWDKPLVGTLTAKNGQPHNVVAAHHGASVFHDPQDADPARRYKMISHDRDRGFITRISPDGLHWNEASPNPFLPISYVDDVISAFRDRRTGEYVALPKMSTPVFGRMRRTIYRSTSYDFIHWSKIEPAYMADRRDDLGSLARIERVRPLLNYPDNFNMMRTEFYGAGAYSAESCVVGFPWVFTASANVPGGSNQDGPIETQFAVTRDLDCWERPFRTPAIPMGKPGEWDGGMILTASQAIDVGDEVWLYYGGANYTHGAPPLYGRALDERGKKYATAIGLATWPHDRFVSADAGPEGGTLTTVPLRFAGQRLEINAVTRDGGEIRVELLDAAGHPLDGIAQSAPFTGDQLRHTVVFPAPANLSALAGRPVSLRFKLRHAELYAFAFRDK